MGQHVLLNNVDHHDLRLISRHGPAFGDGVNQVLIFPSEYNEVQRHYPIFFQKTDTGGLKSVAILGFDKDENLFLNDGGWHAAYVPAMQKVGPFLIGQASAAPGEDLPADAEAMILVDTGHARISKDEGEPLFLSHGGHSPALMQITQILQQVYAGSQISDHMFAAFHDAGLLLPVEIDVKIDDQTSYILKDYLTISQHAFGNLSAEQLKSLNQDGFLALAFYVMSSMSNISHLIRLKSGKNLAPAAM